MDPDIARMRLDMWVVYWKRLDMGYIGMCVYIVHWS